MGERTRVYARVYIRIYLWPCLSGWLGQRVREPTPVIGRSQGKSHIRFKEPQSTLPSRQFQGRRLGTGNVALCGRTVTWVLTCLLSVVAALETSRTGRLYCPSREAV